MAYGIAGIDVHKKKLAVVVSDVEVDEEYQLGSRPSPVHFSVEYQFPSLGTPRGRR